MTAPNTKAARGASSRRRGREVALQTLYAIDVAKPHPPRVAIECAEPASAEAVFERVAANFEAPAGAHEFAWELIDQVTQRGEELDELIAARARNWRISRMAAVDRNILRLAAYELTHTDTPAAVVLDEAVELAGRFGSDPSPAFVNGILDALARDVRGGEL